MATLRETILESVAKLSPVSDSANLDAELLLCHALKCTRAQFYARSTEEMPNSNFEELLARRLKREPIAYILGEWEFFSLPLNVRPPTLVPRPETEHLVELALELLPHENCRALDIGTGTGCIPIAVVCNHEHIRFTASDIKANNLTLAAENAELNGVSERICFIQSDLFDTIGDVDPFDLITSNPPYVPDPAWPGLSDDIRLYEDRDALLSGEEGLDLIRKIIPQAAEYLKPEGHLLLEIGAEQADAVSVLLEENGYNDISFRKDLAGIDRIAMGRKPR
ncbi:MAG: peptide chain release factor N(5)-glutamine methyltransferase [Candidatus Hydrogenedentota bacterium]